MHILAIFLLIALGLEFNPAQAQKRGSFVVDGDSGDWGGMDWLDRAFDTVPDTNFAVDLIGISWRNGVYWGFPDTLNTFLLDFMEPAFQGEEETTVEMFYDTAVSEAYGEPQPPWSDHHEYFRPDHVIGVRGKNGMLTQKFYWRHTGSGWEKRADDDFPELEVAISDGYRLEGKYPFRLIYPQDTDLSGEELRGTHKTYWGIRVSKGEYRDYWPDDYGPPGRRWDSWEPWAPLPWAPLPWTPLVSPVELETWGRIKRDIHRNE